MEGTFYWERFKKNLFYNKEIGLMLDISRMNFEDDYFIKIKDKMASVFEKIREMEEGAIANPDENRMVGHYWLRCPELAPTAEISRKIRETVSAVKEFARRIHSGEIKTEKGSRFKNVLLIGIGGSSLGPRFVADALGGKDKMKVFFIDNTDPDGMDRVFTRLAGELDETLTIVISKSGGTIETRNGMVEARRLYSACGLDFSRHAVSVTQEGSRLDRTSREESWLAAFPMWDWVGGRTSVLSAVGLLPLALQGISIDLLLEGAKRCDDLTRKQDIFANPSALLALSWYAFTGGRGGKQMVVLPYKDRLELFTKYLQQLIMESLGKETDLDGNIVRQGITVLGNKGSTDQHSYLQQLLDGPANFFVTFIEVLKDRESQSPIIAENSTSGDYLNAFLLGTRKALTEKERESVTITIDEINEFSIGVLLALFERAVSIYALLVNINAYHQPAVELGKKGAGKVISIKNAVVNFLKENPGQKYTVEELARYTGYEEETETLFKILLHLKSNPDHGIKAEEDKNIFSFKYWF